MEAKLKEEKMELRKRHDGEKRNILGDQRGRERHMTQRQKAKEEELQSKHRSERNRLG